MDPATVHEILDLFDGAGLDYWIAGGWGVDALIGRQTRDHDDLDISLIDLDGALAVLAPVGFEIAVDWLPGRIAVQRPDGAEVDLHPIGFQPDGSAILTSHEDVEYHYPADAFTTGTISGRSVPCISAALQRQLHEGYPPQAKDIADMAALTAAGL